MFFIENWHICQARLLAGSLAKPRRNQEKTLEASVFLIESEHFHAKLLGVA